VRGAGYRCDVRRTVVVLLVLVVAIVLLAGLHPLTPSRTFDAYVLKARGTAKSALSAVETARLTARAASSGDALGPYVSVVLSESETGAGQAQETFLGIQPPDRRADRLRARLGRLLQRSTDELAQLRIAARRGQLEHLDRRDHRLARIAGALNHFLDTH